MRRGGAAYRLPTTVTPSRYDLTLEPDLHAGTFRGTEDVRIRVHQATQEIVLNAVDLRIDEGRLSDGGGTKVPALRIAGFNFSSAEICDSCSGRIRRYS